MPRPDKNSRPMSQIFGYVDAYELLCWWHTFREWYDKQPEPIREQINKRAGELWDEIVPLPGVLAKYSIVEGEDDATT